MLAIIKQIKLKKSLIPFLVIALLIRAYLLFLPAFKIDIDAWIAWSLRLHDVGFTNFYSPTYFSDYLPGYLYILYLIGFVQKVFSLPLDDFAIVLKVIPTLAEIGLGFFIYHILKHTSETKRLLAVCLIWFNPGLLFNSTVWGQADSLLSLTLLVSVYFLEQKKPIHSASSGAVSFLLKPQTILIAPVFLLDLITRFSLKKLGQFIFIPLFVLFILSWPFFQNPIFGLIEKTLNTANGYQYTSLFAFNIWGIIGMWQDDTQKFGLISYQQWGTILFAAAWLITTFIFLKKKFSYYLLSSLAALFFFFLPTRVHERYLYPAIPFLVISAFSTKSLQKSLIISTIILSLLYFLNLYYVYIYYNENFLHLQQLLTYQPVYNFLDHNLKLLSFLQTLIFIIIVWSILKSAYDRKDKKSLKSE